jgi:general secretion pathway protein A
MVEEYYKLREQPFGVTPDGRYMFSSATHREALASIVCGLEFDCGFIALIAKPGMGKTTLLFNVLDRLRHKARVVFLFQTICTPLDCIRAILGDLGVEETAGSMLDLQARLNKVLVNLSRFGKHLVIVFDEAQALDISVLEFVRMLSNFETAQKKLIQIILSGQPQLARTLASPELLQLKQRFSILARLVPFSAEETALYIKQRLRTAGYSGEDSPFTEEALELIAHCSEGIPRNINNICFNALSLGYATKRKRIDQVIVREVVRDLDMASLGDETPRPKVGAILTESSAKTASSARKSRLLFRWLARVAVAAVVLAGLGVPDYPDHSANKQNRLVLVSAPRNVPTAEIHAYPTRDLAQQSATEADTILVSSGDSLYKICMARFGECSWERMRRIRALNPGLIDVDHIEPGQRIRVLPPPDVASEIQGRAAEQRNLIASVRGDME